MLLQNFKPLTNVREIPSNIRKKTHIPNTFERYENLL